MVFPNFRTGWPLPALAVVAVLGLAATACDTPTSDPTAPSVAPESATEALASSGELTVHWSQAPATTFILLAADEFLVQDIHVPTNGDYVPFDYFRVWTDRPITEFDRVDLIWFAMDEMGAIGEAVGLDWEEREFRACPDTPTPPVPGVTCMDVVMFAGGMRDMPQWLALRIRTVDGTAASILATSEPTGQPSYRAYLKGNGFVEWWLDVQTEVPEVALELLADPRVPSLTLMALPYSGQEHSDPGGDIEFRAWDPDGGMLLLEQQWRPAHPEGLPWADGLFPCYAPSASSVSRFGNAVAAGWTYSCPQHTMPRGRYFMRYRATNDLGEASAWMEVWMNIGAEAVAVEPDRRNPRSSPIDEATGVVSSVEMEFTFTEAQPDQGLWGTLPADLSLAEPAFVLVSLDAIGTGEALMGDCHLLGVEGSGYEQVASMRCVFRDVPLGAYHLVPRFEGGYFRNRAEIYEGLSLFLAYDPSETRAVAGAGVLEIDPLGTNLRADFVFRLEYNRNGKNLQGQFHVSEFRGDGSTRTLRSNALGDLVIEDVEWISGGTALRASFMGRTTYKGPAMAEPEGNYTFTVVALTGDVPDCLHGGSLQVEVRDRAGVLLTTAEQDGRLSGCVAEGGHIWIPAPDGTKQ